MGAGSEGVGEQSDPRAGLLSPEALTRARLDERFARAIRAHRGLRVVKEDVLGEGAGAWDPDPRYPVDAVNCLTWLQLLLCEVYAGGGDRIAVMDRVRYYGGHVAYGTRKHFLDHWLALEPAPLRRIPVGHLPQCRRGAVELDFGHFKEFHRYPCRLYREDVTKIEYDYLTLDGMLEFVPVLRPGYYVAFAAAKARYLELFGKGSGPMGLVHSLVIHVGETAEGGADAGDHTAGAEVFHASTLLGAVTRVGLAEYLESMWSVFDGYALFDLDPSWDAAAPAAEDEAMRSIRRCESTLASDADHRSL